MPTSDSTVDSSGRTPATRLTESLSAKAAVLRVLRWWINRLLVIVVVTWLVLGGLAVVLGYYGFKHQYEAEGKSRSPSDLAYLTLQLVALQCGHLNESGAQIQSSALDAARFLMPLLGLFTAGTALVAVFRKGSQLLLLRLYSNHVIICGLGRKGFRFAKSFMDQGEDVVVIECDEDNDFLEQCRAKGAIVLVGNATDRGLLEKANVRQARRVICLCRDDGTNAEIGFSVREMVSGREGTPLVCQMHIFSTQLCDLLRDRLPRMPEVGGCKLEFFNIFKNGAWTMLHEFAPYNPDRIARDGCAHILVVGLGWIGESVVVQAAVKWRRHEKQGITPKVTIVDREAQRLEGAMVLMYSELMEGFAFEAFDMEVESAEFQGGDFLGGNGCDISMAYVCFDDPSLALSAALHLHRTIERRLPGRDIPIVVKMDHNDGLAKVLPGGADVSGGYSELYAFGLLDRTCQPELIHGDITEIVARRMHQHYLLNPRRTQIQEGATPLPAMTAWEDLSPEDQDSNRQFARNITVKLDMVKCMMGPMTDRCPELFKFTDSEVERLAQVEHERWYAYKQDHGWVWGKVHNKARKENPYFRQWKDLPEDVRELSRCTVRDIPEILAAADLEIYRAG